MPRDPHPIPDIGKGIFKAKAWVFYENEQWDTAELTIPHRQQGQAVLLF